MSESLTDAVDRLLDRLNIELPGKVDMSPALGEAIMLAYLAYRRERNQRGEYASDFPGLGLRLER